VWRVVQLRTYCSELPDYHRFSMSLEYTVKIAPLVRDGDYKEWAGSMRALLVGMKRLDKYLDAEPGQSATEKEEDLLCRSKLELYTVGPLKRIVNRSSTAKSAWEALRAEYIGSLQARQPQMMLSLTQLSQGSLTLVQYIDKAKELRDEFEALQMEASLPLLYQKFITGLSDELQIACAPSLHAILRDKKKGLDDIAAELRSMAHYNLNLMQQPTPPAQHLELPTRRRRRGHATIVTRWVT
jgi:hypothetical protein